MTALTLAAATLAMPALPEPASASVPRVPAHGPEVVRGSAPFGTCPAADVRVVATIAQPVVVRGQVLRVGVVVHDVGPRPCRYDGLPPGTRQPAELGPCGVAPLVVERPDGREVWPGPVAYMCPMEVGRTLAPGATLQAAGTWAQEAGPGSGLPARPPAGVYLVVVAGRLRLPMRVR